MPGKPEGSIAERTNQLTSRLVTQARQKTAGMRTAAQLPQNKLISLLVTGGPLKGQSFPVEKAQILIGRNKGDVIIKDSQISGSHCVLEVHGMSALLVDLDSANGTFVNGRKIANCQLSHMSEFRIGATTLMFALTGGR
jgi:S-DNA-T family DNA segregation ATPase FtsK/SpoIIIE